MKKKVYVIHCPKCKRIIEKDLRDGMTTCPPDPGNKVLCWQPNPHYDGGYERRRFPYYDESLDLHIESSQHKREVLKKRNLVQIDGFFTGRGGAYKRDKRGVIYSIPKGGT